jgi:hypothetical protein
MPHIDRKYLTGALVLVECSLITLFLAKILVAVYWEWAFFGVIFLYVAAMVVTRDPK